MNFKYKEIILKSGSSILLATMIFAIYWQIGDHSFILYDDEDYILLNSRLKSGFTFENIHWFLTSSYASNWHPLTWFSHMLDMNFFGLNATGHHFVSVALHAINAILLFLFLQRFTGSLWRSFAVAALFAVHPLNVESVAWVAERKNILSTLFWILTLYFYATYTEQKSKCFYLLSTSSFILGLMSKQMLVSIPLVLLMLDYWPLRRLSGYSCINPPDYFKSVDLRSLLLEKVPFLLLAVAASIIALISQQKAINPLLSTTLIERIGNASISYILYIRKIFWPNDLAVFYPFPETISTVKATVSAILLISITYVTAMLRIRHSALFIGWVWYLITLIPVIGIVKIGLQSMADRYAYVPTIGIFIMAVWCISDLANNIPHRKLLLSGITCASIMALSVIAWQTTAYWKDTTTLFTHALGTTERNYIALCAIGRSLEKAGKLDEALQRFDEAIVVAPWYDYAKTHQGIILMNRGKIDAAVFKYNEAILQNPTTVPGHINLGIIMALQGRLDEAIKNFQIAIDFDPHSAAANYNMALTLHKLGKNDEAISHYLRALATDPADYDCHYNVGILLEKKGHYKEASQHFKEAMRLKPDLFDIESNLERTLQKQRDSQGF